MNNDQLAGMQVTGDDAADLQAEIDALLANADTTGQQQQQQTQTQQPQQVQGIEIPVAGSTLKFKDSNELGQKLQEIVRNYQLTAAELATLKNQQAQTQTQAAKADGKSSINEEFTKLVQSGEDGVAKALNYAMSHMFFDGKVPDAAKTISALLQQAAANNTDLTVLRFKEAHPELPRTPEAAQAIDAVRQQFNLPFNNDGLEAAYAIAVQRKLVNIEPQQSQTQQQTQQPSLQQHFATPVMSRQSSATIMQPTPAQEEQLWNMPLDKLTTLFHKYHGGDKNYN